MMFLHNEFSTIPHIHYGFFGRKGGVSTGVYDSLNCAYGSNDDHTYVTQNRDIIRSHFGDRTLITAHQTHSNRCVTIDASNAHENHHADALVTTDPTLLLGILTADCVPVLFTDDTLPIIGAAHAGWKGAKSGILASTISQMKTCGAQHISAVIGPCIAQASYEVDAQYRENFLHDTLGNQSYFIPSNRQDHFLFDLTSYVQDSLQQLGLDNIYHLGMDTYSHEEDFFSYRRATHQNADDYGRQLSVIALNTL